MRFKQSGLSARPLSARPLSARPLSARPPMLPANITDIEILQICRIILNINDILRSPAHIRLTLRLRTLHRMKMRQRRILPGKFIEQDFVPLARPLLDKRLRNERSIRLLFRISTIPTEPNTLILLHVQMKIISTRAKFHPFFYTKRLYV